MRTNRNENSGPIVSIKRHLHNALRHTPSLATALCSTRLKAGMQSNKSGRQNRCTRLLNRRRTTVVSRPITLPGRWRICQIPFINAMPLLGRSGRNVAAGNTYGNVQGWVNAANTGLGVILGYEAATINVTPRYPLYRTIGPEGQRIVATQAATSDLGDGIVESNLQTLGTMRANSEARESDIRQMEAETYSNDPAQHTDMATLQRINQATLMQLRAQQDANQIAQAAALQQIVSQKQQQDALKAAFQDAAEYQQQYNSTVRLSHRVSATP